MSDMQKTNKETAAHFREWAAKQHGPFSWPTDGCGYNQSVRFAQYRNEQWEASALDAKEFLLDYANRIESQPDTLCLCIHPNEKVTHLCYCCHEPSCKFHGMNMDGTVFT